MDVRGLRALGCVLVVVACSLAFVSAPTAAAAADSETHRAALQAEQPSGADSNGSVQLEDADRIHIDVFIASNGSARVTVDYQYYLYGENSSAAAWEALEANISNNTERYVAAERESWNDTLAKGQNRTEREMNISNVSITTETDSQPREVGHAVVTFEWSQFALVELNQIKAGAALSGFTLDDGTTLQFRWPDGYTVQKLDGQLQVDPSPREPPDGSVSWRGDETMFTDDQPRIILIENGDSETGQTPSGGDPESEQAPSDGGPAMPWVFVLLALALLATVGAAGWLIGRRRTGGRADTTTNVARRTDGSSAADSTAADGPPPELLSNEERVLRLLETSGGRIKQQEVVSELDWTEAKTSQVVGDLREDGEIEVFRIGRENVLSLPDDE